MKQMEIRLAEPNDIPDLCGLYNDFFIYNAGQQPQYYKPAAETGKYPKSVIDSQTEDIYVAMEDHAVIGFIHIAEEKTPPYDCFVPHKFAVVVDLFVKDNFRGKGVGDQLFEAAKQWAKARKLDYLELNVLAENEIGIRFYNHEEFKAVSQIMRYTL